MDRKDAQETRERGDGLSLFERFVESVNRLVSAPGFFVVAVAIVVAWFVSVPFWADLKYWMAAIHTVSSVLSLLLLVLLENSGRRAEEAAQEKLNVLAEGLAALMESRGRDDPKLDEATERLREAVGLEERH